ncbi:hypothetical protein [Streptomyces sp. NBC_01013]|uniref:hypothetical protein n=1 Tax=Streptomyces sp. NBC_01013 TaxID=2903718 RepID=UPI0038653AFD|nr:hypothetical protein OG538_00525 [Streptomyces sp. NBC_01013]
MAAYDIHRTEALGRCEQSTGIVVFMNMVEQVMAREPYSSAKHVFWIVDNGPRIAASRPSTAWPSDSRTPSWPIPPFTHPG